MSSKIYKIFNSVYARCFPGVYSSHFYRKNTNIFNWRGKSSGFTLSFDCDYQKDVLALPILLDTLSSYSIKTDFACVGRWIKKYPKEHQHILEEGHLILNHTYSHPDNEELNPHNKFNLLTLDQQLDEIQKCDEVCKTQLEYSPCGFRTPHFGNLHTNQVYSLLKGLGYSYCSSSVSTRTPYHGLPYVTSGGIIEYPVSTCPKHPLDVFDTWHSLARGCNLHGKNRDFQELFEQLIQTGITTNSYINVYFDPQDIVKYAHFRDMLEYIENFKNELMICTYEELNNLVSKNG